MYASGILLYPCLNYCSWRKTPPGEKPHFVYYSLITIKKITSLNQSTISNWIESIRTCIINCISNQGSLHLCNSRIQRIPGNCVSAYGNNVALTLLGYFSSRFSNAMQPKPRDLAPMCCAICNMQCAYCCPALLACAGSTDTTVNVGWDSNRQSTDAKVLTTRPSRSLHKAWHKAPFLEVGYWWIMATYDVSPWNLLHHSDYRLQRIAYYTVVTIAVH